MLSSARIGTVAGLVALSSLANAFVCTALAELRFSMTSTGPLTDVGCDGLTPVAGPAYSSIAEESNTYASYGEDHFDFDGLSGSLSLRNDTGAPVTISWQAWASTEARVYDTMPGHGIAYAHAELAVDGSFVIYRENRIEWPNYPAGSTIGTESVSGGVILADGETWNVVGHLETFTQAAAEDWPPPPPPPSVPEPASVAGMSLGLAVLFKKHGSRS